MEQRPLWTVTGVQPDTYWSDTGRPEDGITTRFRTAAGHHGKVTHRQSGFDPAQVAQDIHTIASQLMQVSALQGPPVQWEPESPAGGPTPFPQTG